jgi:1,4-dihydroxy-2-naphthoate polyprenyltransferase
VNVLLGLAPIVTIWVVLLLPIMWQGMRPFFDVQDKKKTFITTVKSASLFFILYPVLFVLGTWL